MIEELLFFGVAIGIAIAALVVGHIGDWLAAASGKFSKINKGRNGAYESGFNGTGRRSVSCFEFVKYVPYFVITELALIWFLYFFI